MNTYQITVTRLMNGTPKSEKFEFHTHLKSNEAVLVKQLMKALTSFYIANAKDTHGPDAVDKIIAQSLALHDPEILFSEAAKRLHIIDCVVSSQIDPAPARLANMAHEIGIAATA